MLKESQITITPDEAELLAWNVPNEIINGFKVLDFEKTIGVPVDQAKAIFSGIRDGVKNGDSNIARPQAVIIRNALAVVIEELGSGEFETRTGSSFQSGCNTLQRLDAFLENDAVGARN